MNYHIFGVSIPTIQEQDDRIIGAKPFGAGLSKWFEAAAGFHFDQVQTPLKIEAIDHDLSRREGSLFFAKNAEQSKRSYLFSQGHAYKSKHSEGLNRSRAMWIGFGFGYRVMKIQTVPNSSNIEAGQR